MSEDQAAEIPLYPDNPCLSRLAAAIQTRDGLPLDPDAVTYSTPRKIDRQPDGSNTAVDVLGVGGPVTVTYERVDLNALAQNDLRIRVGFIPASNRVVELVAALASFYKRAMAPLDFDPECFLHIDQAPNGTYRLALLSAVNSYGWVGKVDVVFDPIMDIRELIRVKQLSAFQYTPPGP